jgi:hypothetical protein
MKIARHFVLALGLMMFGIGNSFADSITVDGRTYDDVLIYKSPSKYYVKVPKTGKTLNFSIDEVDANAVTINDDPYYRDKLKARYELRKMGAPAKEEIDPNFKVVNSGPGEGPIDTSALFGGGGGGGKGLGISQSQAKETLSLLQIKFSGSGNSISGKTPDGTTVVSMTGPKNNITKINLAITSTDPALIQQKLTPLVPIVTKVAPWSIAWLQQSMAQFQQTGKIEKTQGGVTVRVTASSPTPQSLTMNFTISS